MEDINKIENNNYTIIKNTGTKSNLDYYKILIYKNIRNNNKFKIEICYSIFHGNKRTSMASLSKCENKWETIFDCDAIVEYDHIFKEKLNSETIKYTIFNEIIDDLLTLADHF
jgi:hypothetical protein